MVERFDIAGYTRISVDDDLDRDCAAFAEALSASAFTSMN